MKGKFINPRAVARGIGAMLARSQFGAREEEQEVWEEYRPGDFGRLVLVCRG